MRSFKFNIRGNNYEVEVQKIDGDLAEIEVNGTLYQVDVERKKVESKTPILVRSAMPTSMSPSDVKVSAKEKSVVAKIIAPLPGTVIQIMINPGAAVKRGDKLLVYEAMKMENNLLAEKDGTVKSIKVNVGDNFLQGDLLIEME